MPVTFGYLTNSTTTLLHKHNEISIYVGNRTTDKISLGNVNCNSAYLGNIPVSKSENVYYDIVCGTGEYMAKSNGNYVVTKIKNCSDLNLFTRGSCPLTSNGALYVIAGSQKYATHLYVIPRNTDILPRINLCGGKQVDTEVIQLLDKKCLKIGPVDLSKITKTTYPIEFYKTDSTYKYQSTYCLLECPENDYNVGIKFEFKSLKGSSSSGDSPICQNTKVYGSHVTGCTDFYGKGNYGTQFRIFIGALGNNTSAGLGFLNNSGFIWYSTTPSTTEIFSLSGGVDKGAKPLNISVNPTSWKYTDLITINF